MRLQFFIFISIFFGIYFLVNTYVFLRGWQALEYFPQFKIIYAIVFWILAITFVLGRFLEQYFRDGLNTFLVWTGSFWLAFITYFFLFVVAIDIARSLITIFGKAPQLWTANYLLLKFWTGSAVFLISSVIIGIGFWNALTPKIKELEISIDKDGGTKKEWNVVLASDIHVGTIVNRTRFDKLVDSINKINPDLVLLAGDTVDEDIKPVIQQDIGNALKNIKSNYGVYGITGNHEYIGGVKEAVDYLSEHGVRILRDEAVLIDSSFYLVGREDHNVENFNGPKRKTLEELLMDINAQKPIIMLDHQPFDLVKVAEDGRVDAQFSGHTHNGQLWPFNYITQAVYEISWGYEKIQNTNFYVSSGWGTWGPPVRLGNTPELVHIKLKFR